MGCERGYGGGCERVYGGNCDKVMVVVVVMA